MIMMEVNPLKLILLFLTFNIVEIVTARDAPPIIIPEQGTIIGTYMKMYRTQNIMAYLGIPYAQPPILHRRFTPPIVDNLPNWDGVRNATYFQPDCWQSNNRPLKKHNELFMKLLKASRSVDDTKRYDEDCLFLNIFIPDGPPPMEGYAVIVWLHSGDFTYGSPNDLDPFQLVFKQKVIVVTVAFRLGIFGFFTTVDGESAGNFGLMDQSAALLWIRRNIKLFGGNDNSITIMGHGSGSKCVGLHLTSGEWSDGLFHKAIMMSGSALTDSTVRDPTVYNPILDATAHAFGCFRRPTSRLIECMRNANAAVLSEFIPAIDWGPIMDDGLSNATTPFITDYPKNLIERGTFRQVPILIGYTDMEEVLDILMADMMENGINSEMYDTLLTDIILSELSHIDTNDSCGGNHQMVIDAVSYTYKTYPEITEPMMLRKLFIDFNTERNYIAPSILLASAMSTHAPTYVYRFDIKPRTIMAKDGVIDWVGVPHNYDLIFVWGMPYWTNQDMMNMWDSADKRVSDIIMTLWTNFAKFSNPAKFGVYIKWDRFMSDNQKMLVIDRSFNMSGENTIDYRAVKFWNDYYPRVLQHAATCCNGTNDATQTFSTNKSQMITIISHMLLVILIFYKNVQNTFT